MKVEADHRRKPTQRRANRRWLAGLALLAIVGTITFFHWRWATTPWLGVERVQPPLPSIAEAPLRGKHATWTRGECLAATAAFGPKNATVHRWVDANGVVTFSDRPPQETVQDHRVSTHSDETGVEVVVHEDGRALPPRVRAEAIATAAAIGKIFRLELGVTWTTPLRLRLHFTSSREEMAQRVGLDSADRSGVYSPGERTIYVRRQATDARTLEVLRHEISHALVHEWIGRLPTVLNEGLAEYFEHLKVVGIGGEVDTTRFARRWKRDAGDSARSELQHLLGAGGDFYGPGEGRRYTQALALATWLMDDPARRGGLARIFSQQRADSCRSMDPHEIALALGYAPADLVTQWAGFLTQPQFGLHSF